MGTKEKTGISYKGFFIIIMFIVASVILGATAGKVYDGQAGLATKIAMWTSLIIAVPTFFLLVVFAAMFPKMKKQREERDKKMREIW